MAVNASAHFNGVICFRVEVVVFRVLGLRFRLQASGFITFQVSGS
jgi:hypothetical protein